MTLHNNRTNVENGWPVDQGTEDTSGNGNGRPIVIESPEFQRKLDLVYGYLDSGDVREKDAADYLGIGTTTLRSLLRPVSNSDLRSLRRRVSHHALRRLHQRLLDRANDQTTQSS